MPLRARHLWADRFSHGEGARPHRQGVAKFFCLLTHRSSVRGPSGRTKTTLIAAIAQGRRWLKELIEDPAATTESIANRTGCSARKVNMTISLAFLAPDLVKAAIDGHLPHGLGIARLCDLPIEWARQHEIIGLAAY